MKALIYLSFLFLFGHAYKDKQQSSDILDILGFKVDPDVKRNVSLLISSKGYPVENYDVQTTDGYILSVQRIPHGIKSSHNSKKPAVLLQHGLLSSATDWVINFANQSLGYLLADAGFDVWLGNARGNTYSRRHVNRLPSERSFWNFSFDEMAEYDLPAVIDFILNKTDNDQLFYVGHSQGTSAGFAMLSQFPELNKKVKLMVALAPVASVGYITSAIRYLTPFTNDVEFMFKILGVNEFLPSDGVMKYLSELVCSTRMKFLCSDVIFLICGEDMAQLNMTRLNVYTAHSPAGTSTQSIIHYAQMVRSKVFQKFDFGEKGNKKHYNQTTPPKYHVERITSPVALFWSKNDKLADPTDVGLLQQQLTSLVASTCVKNPLFNHIDFIWGIDAAHSVYDDVITLLKKYSY